MIAALERGEKMSNSNDVCFHSESITNQILDSKEYLEENLETAKDMNDCLSENFQMSKDEINDSLNEDLESKFLYDISEKETKISILKTYKDVASSPIFHSDIYENLVTMTGNALKNPGMKSQHFNGEITKEKTRKNLVDYDIESEESILSSLNQSHISSISCNEQLEEHPESSVESNKQDVTKYCKECEIEEKYNNYDKASSQTILASSKFFLHPCRPEENITLKIEELSKQIPETISFNNNQNNGISNTKEGGKEIKNNEKLIRNEEIKEFNADIHPKSCNLELKETCHEKFNNGSTEITSQLMVDSKKLAKKTDKELLKKVNTVSKSERTTTCSQTMRHIITTTPTNSFKTPKKSQQEENYLKSTENIDFEQPSQNVADEIISRVEFYFTDFNILKNNFLLKHIRKSKEGFISLKLVTSFRKVKSLTKNWRVVANCLEKSKLLELNSEKTKVRRIKPVPKIEDTSFGKTIVIFNLPLKNSSIEKIKELFGKFGKITHSEIMSSKSKNYNLYHKKCIFFNSHIASFTFAIVEFEKFTDTLSALKDYERHLPKENTMSVVPLVVNFDKIKSKQFGYKTSVPPHSRHEYRRSYQKIENPPKVYSYHESNSFKASKCYSSEGYITKEKYLPGINYTNVDYRFYPKHFNANMNTTFNISPLRYANNYVRYAENWRENRQLKSNTSMNIERQRSAPAHDSSNIQTKNGLQDAKA